MIVAVPLRSLYAVHSCTVLEMYLSENRLPLDPVNQQYYDLANICKRGPSPFSGTPIVLLLIPIHEFHLFPHFIFICRFVSKRIFSLSISQVLIFMKKYPMIELYRLYPMFVGYTYIYSIYII